jgi:hypothetical protein
VNILYKDKYRFDFICWDKNLNYWITQSNDTWHTFENDNLAILAAEVKIEQKLKRGAGKVSCTVQFMKSQFVAIRHVITLQRPKSAFRKPSCRSGNTHIQKVTPPNRKKN